MKKMMRALKDTEPALLAIMAVVIAVFIGTVVFVVVGLCNGTTFSGSGSAAITSMNTVIRMTCY